MAADDRLDSAVAASNAILQALAAAKTREDLALLMDSIAWDLGFRFFALIHHDDLRGSPEHRVDIKNYPEAVSERIIGQGMWRRDPVVRGCAFAEAAFLWSNLPSLIHLDHRDHRILASGAREGLDEGITVPSAVLGQCTGSCTFAGTVRPDVASRALGMAQIAGIFAFQAAKRVIGLGQPLGTQPRLHPRPRDCVVLAGRGLSNKEIARALAITPRTVDGYLTEARLLLHAHDRTELVISALLAGEVALHELDGCQPLAIARSIST